MSAPAPNSNGMYKFVVHGNSTASASIMFEFTAEDVAEHFGSELDEVDRELIKEYAREQFYTQAPQICAQCTGWGREYSMELSDVWEIEEKDGVEELNG